jgi:hypothetical protein
LNTGGVTNFSPRFAGELTADVNGTCTGSDCAAAGGQRGITFPCFSQLDIGVRNLDAIDQ